MTICPRKLESTRNSKEKSKKIGVRSIYDVINNNHVDMEFEEKVNFIRHRFTYYEGNYDLFHNHRGKANKRKKLLNNIIISVVKKEVSPSVLRKFNKKIMLWKSIEKERVKQKLLDEEQRRIRNYKEHDWYTNTLINKNESMTRWQSLIVSFINSKDNNLDPEILQHIRYKRIKEVVNLWLVKKDEIDYNSWLLDKYPLYEIVYDKKENTNG